MGDRHARMSKWTFPQATEHEAIHCTSYKNDYHRHNTDSYVHVYPCLCSVCSPLFTV